MNLSKASLPAIAFAFVLLSGYLAVVDASTRKDFAQLASLTMAGFLGSVNPNSPKRES